MPIVCFSLPIDLYSVPQVIMVGVQYIAVCGLGFGYLTLRRHLDNVYGPPLAHEPESHNVATFI